MITKPWYGWLSEFLAKEAVSQRPRARMLASQQVNGMVENRNQSPEWRNRSLLINRSVGGLDNREVGLDGGIVNDGDGADAARPAIAACHAVVTVQTSTAARPARAAESTGTA